MISTICVFLNSKTANSYVNGYTSECMFVLPQLTIPKNRKISVSVQTASIPYSFFNVDDFNDKFDYTTTTNGITSTFHVIIPQGNYNVTTLITQLKLLMGANFNIVYNSLSNTYTFTNSLYEFSFLSASKCFELMGFNDGFTYSSVGKSLTSTISINMFTIRNIYISSNNFILNNINSSTPNNCSILVSIPIQSSANSVITYINNYNTNNEVHSLHTLTLLHLKLTDQDGDILDLNGVHWSCTLQFDISK